MSTLFRKINTLLILLKNFCRDCVSFSFSVACGRLIRDVPFIAWDIRRSIYEKSIYNYLNNMYGHLIQQYALEEGNLVDTPVIWVMWWQGISNMPPIVKACYDNLKSVSSQKVVLITKSNYHEWIEIPSYIVRKMNEGFISITHFSDIIRMALLEQYGGLWVDATMYIKCIPEEALHSYLYTLHSPGMFPNFINRGEWSTFLMSTNIKHCRLYGIIRIILLQYWKTHSEAIDYLFLDYLIRIITDYHCEIKKHINNMPINSHYYDLNLSINDGYNNHRAQEMMNSSVFQKLTYKKEFFLIDKYGNETNYSKIISGHYI